MAIVKKSRPSMVVAQWQEVQRNRDGFPARDNNAGKAGEAAVQYHCINPSCLALMISSNNPLALWRKIHLRIRLHVRVLAPLTHGRLTLTSPLPSTRLHSNMTPLDSGAYP